MEKPLLAMIIEKVSVTIEVAILTTTTEILLTLKITELQEIRMTTELRVKTMTIKAIKIMMTTANQANVAINKVLLLIIEA